MRCINSATITICCVIVKVAAINCDGVIVISKYSTTVSSYAVVAEEATVHNCNAKVVGIENSTKIACITIAEYATIDSHGT